MTINWTSTNRKRKHKNSWRKREWKGSSTETTYCCMCVVYLAINRACWYGGINDSYLQLILIICWPSQVVYIVPLRWNCMWINFKLNLVATWWIFKYRKCWRFWCCTWWTKLVWLWHCIEGNAGVGGADHPRRSNHLVSHLCEVVCMSVRMYVYVCVYIHMFYECAYCIGVCTYMCVCGDDIFYIYHLFTWLCVCMCLYVCICICAWHCVCAYVCKYVCTNIYVYVRMYTCV